MDDLDTYLAEKAAEATPEDDERAIAPIQGYGARPPAAPQPMADDAPLTQSELNALERKSYREAMGNDPSAVVPPQLADIESRLGSQVDKNGKPVGVPGNSPFSGFGNMLAQSGQARAKLMADNPYVSLGDKMAAAKSAAFAGGLGGVLNNLVDKKKNDYEDQLNSDAKRAQMFRALHPSNRGSGGAATSLGVINAAQRDKLYASNQAKYDAKVAAAEAENDPKSPTSEAFRTAAYKTGIWNPGELDDMSKAQIAAARVARMQTARIDAGGSEADRKAHNELVTKEELARGEEQRRLADENRKEQRRRAEAEIPGIVWTGAPPGEKAQNEVRDLLPAYRALVGGSHELADIQDKLKSRWGVASGLGQSLGVFMADQETKNLLAKADKIREQQINAARVAYNYGAPQFYELERLGGNFPRPGDIKSYLTGTANWKANAETADRELRAKLKERHAMLPDDPDVYSANQSEPDPASQVQKIDRGAYQHYQPRTGAPAQTAGAAESVPTVSEKLPQAPVAPVAKPERATNVPSGTYVVKTKSGWSSPRQLTAAQAAHLVENGAELKAAQ